MTEIEMKRNSTESDKVVRGSSNVDTSWFQLIIFFLKDIPFPEEIHLQFLATDAEYYTSLELWITRTLCGSKLLLVTSSEFKITLDEPPNIQMLIVS